MKRSRLFIFTALFLLSGVCAKAQMLGLEIGGWVGGSNYFGDLNTSWRLNRFHVAGGATARYNFGDRLGVRLGLGVGALSATDSDSKNTFERARNLDFRTHLVDGFAVFEFNFLPYIHGHKDFFATPYVYAGPGIYFFNPKTDLEGVTYELVEMGTEGQFRGEEYNTMQGSLVYGMGIKVDLNYRWSLNFDLNSRILFTDYLDDVSGVYADIRDIRAQRGDIAASLADRSGEPPLGLPGRQRGNGKSNDFYIMAGVGILYYFGYISCPGILR